MFATTILTFVLFLGLIASPCWGGGFGNVIAEQKGKNLTVEPDGGSPAFPAYRIEELAPDEFRVVGFQTTTVNGAPSVTFTGITGNVTAALGSDGGIINVKDASITGSLFIKLGPGGSHLVDIVDTSVAKNVKVDGARAASVDVGYECGTCAAPGIGCTVDGSFSFKSGGSTSDLTLCNVLFAKNVKVTGKPADEEIILAHTTIDGSLAIKTRPGMSTISLTEVRTASKFELPKPSSGTTRLLSADSTFPAP